MSIINNNGQETGFLMPNWEVCQKPPQKNMYGQYCNLEPLSIDKHSEQLFSAFIEDSDEYNWTYLPYGPFDNVKSFSVWLEECCLGDDPQFQVIIDKETNKALGMASYLRIVPIVGVIEVGHIHYSNKMQRTCVATEAMYLMMSRVFDELGYRRYEWKCDALNARSCRAAGRFGFTFEGIFRQATIYKGRNRDTAWYSIIDSEWPKIKSAYEDWLNPNNFDTNGNQLNSLSF
jgi:RimJ/RimL family protein N-acetyltransferase